MKSVDELYKESLENEELKKDFVSAFKAGRILYYCTDVVGMPGKAPHT